MIKKTEFDSAMQRSARRDKTLRDVQAAPIEIRAARATGRATLNLAAFASALILLFWAFIGADESMGRIFQAYFQPVSAHTQSGPKLSDA